MNVQITALVAGALLALAPASLPAQRGQTSDSGRAMQQQLPPNQRMGQLLRQRLDLTDALDLAERLLASAHN